MADIGFRATVSSNDVGATGTPPAGTDTKWSGCTTITLPDRELGTQPATNHDQTDYYERVIATLIKGGTLKFEMQYTSAQYSRADAAFTARANWTFKVFPPPVADAGVTTGLTHPMGFSFPGLLTKLGGTAYTKDGEMMFAVEVTVNGPWTIVAAS